MDTAAVNRMKKISKLRSEQITTLIGWRWIYPEIQKCGYFGKSIQEVYNVGFRTAVHAMNLNLVTGS